MQMGSNTTLFPSPIVRVLRTGIDVPSKSLYSMRLVCARTRPFVFRSFTINITAYLRYVLSYSIVFTGPEACTPPGKVQRRCARRNAGASKGCACPLRRPRDLRAGIRRDGITAVLSEIRRPWTFPSVRRRRSCPAMGVGRRFWAWTANRGECARQDLQMGSAAPARQSETQHTDRKQLGAQSARTERSVGGDHVSNSKRIHPCCLLFSDADANLE